MLLSNLSMATIDFIQNNILSIITWLPIIIGIVVLLANELSAKIISICSVAVLSILSILLFCQFDQYSYQLQFQEFHAWIPMFDIYYHLGIDGISMPIVILNNLIVLIVILISIKAIKHKVQLYYSMFLIMTGCVSGALLSIDAILFYVFFEAMLIPMYLIIGIYGGKNRIYATIKFFLYTMFGSLFLLLAILYLHKIANFSFNIFDFHKLHNQLDINTQMYLFVALFLAFAVKIPMWPLHTWLPDAHPEAPTAGSIVLAAITLKLGGYGFLRFILPILPEASFLLKDIMCVLSMVAIIYIGLIAIVQNDMKKLIAYSSISHMGFVTLGLFSFHNQSYQMARELSSWGLQGAMIQMTSHGFISAAMFASVGVLYDRFHSKNISDYAGIASRMPIFSAFFMLFAMANCGLPFTSGFVGEFMVIIGSAQFNITYAIIASISLLLGASYTLWMYKKIIFGEFKNSSLCNNSEVADLIKSNLRSFDVNYLELIVFIILALFIILLGVYPSIILDKVNISFDHLISHVRI